MILSKRPALRLAGLLVLVGIGAVSASVAVARPTQATAFTIGSSLTGMKVLPHRVRWVGYPSANVGSRGVDFLIDGKLVMRNRQPSHAFGEVGRDASGSVKSGFLVTSWLTPGMHSFTVRACSPSPCYTDTQFPGARPAVIATKTVVARVVAAPIPPAQLAGTWTKRVPKAIPGDPGALYNGPAAAGTYRMVIDSRFIQHLDPHGIALNSDYSATPTTFTIGAPVWTTPAKPLPKKGPLVQTNPRESGWCEPWGPDATYSWSVSGNTLTLAPQGGTDSCKQRGAVMTGDWTRAG